MNIVPTLDRAVGPDAVADIARTLGVEVATAREAVAAALPALLAMLSGKGSAVSGAGAIFDRVRDERTPHDIGPLLGEDETRSLARAVDGHSGIGEGRAIDLIGILGPMVLGVLAGEIERQHLDKTGFSRFLRDQRAAIAEALPAGFAGHVSGSRHFDTFRTGFASDTTAPMTDTTVADPVALAKADYAATVRKPTAMRLGIAGILVLLAGAWLFYAVGSTPRAMPPPPTALEQHSN